MEINNESLSADKKREIRAYGILGKGDLPKIIDKEHFLVPSQSSSKRYNVTKEESWSCDCPDFINRKLECKHIKAIKMFLKLRNSQDNGVLELQQEIIEDKIVCSVCKSENIIKRGILKTTTEQKQRYGCKDCKKRFVVQILNRTKVNAKMVTLIMDLYYKGNSLRDIKDTIKQFFSIDLHHETIRRYILKFTDVMNKKVENITPTQIGNRFQIDEQKCRTKHNEWLWSWNCIDQETRFVIANTVTKGRSVEEAQKIFTEIRKKTKKDNNITLVTDAMLSYPHAIGKEYHKLNDWNYNFTIKHIFKAGLKKKEENNNTVERYHGQYREFDKIRRGVEEVKTFNDGFKLYHNFIREHSKLGTTPAIKAGIDLNLGNNKWLSLLKQAV